MRPGGIAFVVFAALVACEKERAPAQINDPAPISSLARALGVDAATFEIPVDPPSPPGDLRADIDHFTTLDACVIQHAQNDPLIGDALRAIGYETFLRDACRMLDALKNKNRNKCASIDGGGLRSRCEAQVAMLTANPDACPWQVPDTPLLGREATCVAVASHDLRLCMATMRADRASCEALVMQSDARCTDERTKAACKRDVARWRSVLERPKTDLEPLPTPHARLELRGVEGTTDPAQPDTDLASDVIHGTVLTESKDGLRISFGALHEVGVPSLALSPGGRARLALTVFLPIKPAKAGDVILEHAEIEVPGASTIVVPGVRCDCSVKIEKLGHVRADGLQLTLEGTMGAFPHAYSVRSEIQTFVRDVVVLP